MEWLSEWVQEVRRLNFLVDPTTVCQDGLHLEINWPMSDWKTLKLFKDTRKLIQWLIWTRSGCKGIWRKCPPPIIFIRFTTTIYKKIPDETGDRSPIFNLYPRLSPPIPLFWYTVIKACEFVRIWRSLIVFRITLD
jgi:hypothetical protein